MSMHMTRSPLRAAEAMLAAGLILILSGMPGVTAAQTAETIPLAGVENIQVSHDSFLTHAEPAVAVNPRNPRNLLAAAMDVAGSPVPGTFSSFDGGRTWHDNGTIPLPPGDTEGGDVSVAFAAGGSGFVAAEAASSLSPDVRGIFVWRTDDGGRSFRRPVRVAPDGAVDHPRLAVSPASAVLYLVWATRGSTAHGDTEGLAFSRSVDGGRSFSAPRIISAPPGGPTAPAVTAGPAGAVYAAYETTAPGNTLVVQVVGSTDQGRHFGPPTTVGPAVFAVAPGPGVIVPSGPEIAADRHQGDAYVVYAAAQGTSPDEGIVLSHSRDGGRTWSVPARFSHTSLSSRATFFQPQIAVDDAGGVDVTYLAMAQGKVDLLTARSTTHGDRFAPAQRITSRPFDPALAPAGGKEGLWWIGDYQGLAAGHDAIHPIWSDTRSGQLEIFTAAVPLPAAH